MDADEVLPYVDRVEQCTCCRELFPWALLEVKINAQDRVLILCAVCTVTFDRMNAHA